jgi:protein-tyrosine phosphatase
MTSVLFLCRANVCRSPMAAALLRSRLERAGGGCRVSSAATMTPGHSADPATVQIMAARGIDITGHRSRAVTAADLTTADLVLAMSRENLRHAVVLEPRAWMHTFTFKELIRRAQADRPRHFSEPVADWLARISRGRERSQLLGGNDADDVADPAGQPLRAYEVTAELLTGLVDDLVDCCWGGISQSPTRSTSPAGGWFSWRPE